MEFLVAAKPIEWVIESYGQQLNEGQYGFSITHDFGEEEDYRYHASWGEGPDDSFATLAEAQQWCQSNVDDWVRQIALVTPNIESERGRVMNDSKDQKAASESPLDCRVVRAELDALKALMAELLEQLGERDRGDGDAPGHCHEVPGVWDRDNGKLAGKPCAWCAVWNKAKATGLVHNVEGEPGTTKDD